MDSAGSATPSTAGERSIARRIWTLSYSCTASREFYNMFYSHISLY